MRARILGSCNAKGKYAKKAVGRISIQFMQQVDEILSSGLCKMNDGSLIQLTSEEREYLHEFTEEVMDIRMATPFNLQNYCGWPTLH